MLVNIFFLLQPILVVPLSGVLFMGHESFVIQTEMKDVSGGNLWKSFYITII